jgi:hypothetical protein
MSVHDGFSSCPRENHPSRLPAVRVFFLAPLLKDPGASPEDVGTLAFQRNHAGTVQESKIIITRNAEVKVEDSLAYHVGREAGFSSLKR